MKKPFLVDTDITAITQQLTMSNYQLHTKEPVETWILSGDCNKTIQVQYVNNKASMISNFSNGLLDGKQTTYDAEGVIIDVKYYNNGKEVKPLSFTKRKIPMIAHADAPVNQENAIRMHEAHDIMIERGFVLIHATQHHIGDFVNKSAKGGTTSISFACATYRTPTEHKKGWNSVFQKGFSVNIFYDENLLVRTASSDKNSSLSPAYNSWRDLLWTRLQLPQHAWIDKKTPVNLMEDMTGRKADLENGYLVQEAKELRQTYKSNFFVSMSILENFVIDLVREKTELTAQGYKHLHTNASACFHVAKDTCVFYIKLVNTNNADDIVILDNLSMKKISPQESRLLDCLSDMEYYASRVKNNDKLYNEAVINNQIGYVNALRVYTRDHQRLYDERKNEVLSSNNKEFIRYMKAIENSYLI